MRKVTMSRVILALLVIVAVAYALPSNPLAPRNCGENEQFVTCGSACEPSCGVPKSDLCTLQCIIGCQCKPGFLRNSAQSCVSPHQC